jgi:hypothetical protein
MDETVQGNKDETTNPVSITKTASKTKAEPLDKVERTKSQDAYPMPILTTHLMLFSPPSVIACPALPCRGVVRCLTVWKGLSKGSRETR